MFLLPHLSFRYVLPAITVFVLISGCLPGRKDVSFKETAGFKKALDLGDQRVAEGRVAEGRKSLDSAFVALQPLSVADSYNYYKFYAELNTRHLKDYEQAFRYTDTLKTILERNGATEAMSAEYAVIYYTRGDLFFQAGDLEKAYQEFFNGREVGKKSLDACALSDYNYRMGMVLYKQERYLDALKEFKKCREVTARCQDKLIYQYRIQEVISNIGLCYYSAHMYDSAAYYYEDALDFIEKKIQRETIHQQRMYHAARAVVIGNLGSVYEQKKDYPRAEELYNESIRINLENYLEQHDALFTYLKLARLYHRTGRESEMLRVLEEDRKMLVKMPDVHASEQWNYLMAQYYQSKDPGLAYKYLLDYNHYRDSILQLTRDLRQSDVREHLKNIEKEHKISVLQDTSTKNTRFLFLAVIIAVFCIVVTFIVSYYLRRIKKYMKQMVAMNARITDQKKQLEETMQSLEASNKEKDKIMNVVAHDLRSPVAAIYALADLVLADESLSGDQKETLELIKTASNNSLTLSKEILDTAVLMNQKELNREAVNISEMLHGNIELLRFRAAEKKQKIDLQIPSEAIMVNLDKDKFSRLINNIVTNAIKFSPEGKSIHVGMTKRANDVLLSVRDEGIGIPPKIQDRVFDMFTTAKREGTLGEKPYGLGLSIARQIIKSHGGDIWFESEDRKGTTFFIALPYNIPDPASRSRK